MAILIVEKTEALPKRPLFVVIYSEPGMGKTSLSFTAQKEILFVDFDKGVSRAIKKVRPLSVLPEKWADFAEFVFSKSDGGLEHIVKSRGIKTIALDTIGAALDDFLAPHLVQSDRKNGNGSGGLGLSGFGVMQSTFGIIKARLSELGLNVVAVCHAREGDNDENKRWTLNVKGGTKDVIQRSADLIGFMFLKQGKRIIDFQPREWHIGKDIAGFGEIEVPDASTDTYDTFLDNLFERANDHMAKLSQAQAGFYDAMNEWQAVIDSLSTQDDFIGLERSITEVSDSILRKSIVALFTKAAAKTEMSAAIEAAATPEQYETLISGMANIPASMYRDTVKNQLAAKMKAARLKYDGATKKVIPS